MCIRDRYKAELSTSPVGSMVKLENLFNGLHENIDFLEKKIEQYQNDLEASKAEYDKPFEMCIRDRGNTYPVWYSG